MAGIAGVPSAVRGRRALDAALNPVPFIDLLSCCIAFLLTAAADSTAPLPPAHDPPTSASSRSAATTSAPIYGWPASP